MRSAARFAFAVLLVIVAFGSVLSGNSLGFTVGSWDKIIHFSGWFALAFFAALGWPAWRGLALVGLPLVGLALEVAQTITPTREFSWLDAFANAAGIGVAVAVSAMLTRWLDRE